MSDKTIRFIDSDYRELFQVPDGASITVTYPPGDDRGTITRPCKYLDEMHVRIGTYDYHICEFAERMEALGARHEPTDQLRNIEILPFAADEGNYFNLRSDEGKTRIGHLVGDFGNQGDRFYASSHINEKRRDKNTPAFKAELHSVVYALRQDLLQNKDMMIGFCRLYPEAFLDGDSRYSAYGFKLETDHRQYFIRCHFQDRDARFMVYAYDKAVPLLELEKSSVLGQLRKARDMSHPIKEADEQKQVRSKNERSL
jgi:hypothetical protein